MTKKRIARPKAKTTGPRFTKARLEELIEEATVDAYGESEQVTAIYTMIEENLSVPFETTILGVPITVQRVDLDDAEEIVAICKRGDKRQRIPVLDLPIPSPPPAGIEWVEAYRHWHRGWRE